MQWTIRGIPPSLDEALRQRAAVEHKSLNAVVIEAITRGLGFSGKPVAYRDLSGVAGTWVEDPEFDKALEDQQRIDEELWR